MKYKMRLIVVFLSGFLLVCCDGNLDDQVYRLEISNESSDIIEINSFDRKSSDFVKKIELMDNESYSKDFLVNQRYTDFTPSYVLEGDSLKIIFKNADKISIYICDRSSNSDESDCGVSGNILNFGDPKWIIEQNVDVFLRNYIFTEKILKKQFHVMVTVISFLKKSPF